MKLKFITFTGPDDRTDPEAMLLLSQAFPQVEWGILLSPSQAKATKGSTRFPSHRWLHRARLAFHGTPAHFAGHLCGRYVRDLFNGDFTAFLERSDDFRLFRRYQMNFHGNLIPADHQLVDVLRNRHDSAQFIFQMDGTNEATFHMLREKAIRLVPLFDQSHGEGTLPDSWPTLVDGLCGFAGGLGPDNLEDQLSRLQDHVGDREVWVDMETRIRNEQDEFDLDMVKRCIDIAAPYF